MNYGGGYQSMGGGGFMQDVGSPVMDSSQRKKSNRSQTLIPVTGAILHKAEYNATEDVFRYDGIDLNQITFVGIIREVQEAATNISYKVDDQTGEHVSVKKWIDNEEPGADQLKRSECREDTYVRVTGNMKAFNEGQMRSVIAFSITPLHDFNEISLHMLDVVHAYLMLKKGIPASAPRDAMQTPQRYDQATPMRKNLQDAFGGGGGMMDAGLTGNNKLVYTHISACQLEQGISIQELRVKMKNVSESILRNSIEWLSNEGHIYSTIDDDHYRSTSN